MSGFQMFAISYLSEIRTLCPVFRRLLFSICLKTGRICPDFRRLQSIYLSTSENRTLCPVFRCLLFPICLKTGRYVRFSDVRFEIVRIEAFKALEPDVR